MSKVIEERIVEVKLNKSLNGKDLSLGGLSTDEVVAIRYNANHFTNWTDRVRVYLHTYSGTKGDTIACGIVGWTENGLNYFIEKHGFHSRVIDDYP